MWFKANIPSIDQSISYGQIMVTGRPYVKGCKYARLTARNYAITAIHKLISEFWITKQPTNIFSIHGENMQSATGKGTN